MLSTGGINVIQGTYIYVYKKVACTHVYEIQIRLWCILSYIILLPAAHLTFLWKIFQNAIKWRKNCRSIFNKPF